MQPKKGKVPGSNHGKLAEVEEPQASFSYLYKKTKSTGTRAMAKITGCLLQKPQDGQSPKTKMRENTPTGFYTGRSSHTVGTQRRQECRVKSQEMLPSPRQRSPLISAQVHPLLRACR